MTTMPKANTLQIDLWLWPLHATPDQLAHWRTYLDAAEQARMARFMFSRDQTRFTICRSRLRRILGFYTATPPRDIEFTAIGRGKPALAGANPRNLTFNLSHTDGLACLAVSHGCAIGVDIERFRAIKDDFIKSVLNPAENARITPLHGAARQQAFLRFWTAKEAYLKSIGTGLWQSLKTFDVDIDVDQRATAGLRRLHQASLPRIDDADERARNWSLLTFTATTEHVGAIAVAPAAGTVIHVHSRWLGGQPGGAPAKTIVGTIEAAPADPAIASNPGRVPDQ